MANSKDINRLVKQAQGWKGWRVVEVKKGWMIYPPDKNQPPISVHKTPSDHRAWQNTLRPTEKSRRPHLRAPMPIRRGRTMGNYIAELTLQTHRKLTEATLMDVAEIGGVAVGRPGEKRLETTLSVGAADTVEAARAAIDRITQVTPGRVLAIDVMTPAEQDRRLEERDELIGISEIADELEISRQRVSALSKRDDFPEPVVRLAAGPVWHRSDFTRFKDSWQQKPGRPRKAVAGG